MYVFSFSILLYKYLNIFSYKLTIIVYKLQLHICVEGTIRGSNTFIKAIMHKRFPPCVVPKKGTMC